jgi:hypothetical protein
MSLTITSQNENLFLNGTITFEVEEKLTDEPKFNQSLKKLLRKVDSVLIKKKVNIGQQYSMMIPTLKLVYDPRERNDIIPISLKYEFNDSIVTSTVLKYNRINGYIKEIDTNGGVYKLISPRDSTVFKKGLEYEFKENTYCSLKEFRDSVKVINGYNCFKVVITEKESRSFEGINFIDLFPNSYKFTEVYVTEDIKSLFHPIIVDKEILSKYYPLEIKQFSDLLKGYQVYLYAKEIKTKF